MSMDKKFEELEAELSDILSTPPEIEGNVSFKSEKVRQLKLENENLANANIHRNRLVTWMIVVVSLWLIFAGVMVILQLSFNCGLTSAEMCALLTTTTANVLGLAVIVLKGLFRKA